MSELLAVRWEESRYSKKANEVLEHAWTIPFIYAASGTEGCCRGLYTVGDVEL